MQVKHFLSRKSIVRNT